MHKFPFTPFLIVITFFISVGLSIGLQSVFGVNIGSNLDFGGIRRIIGLPVPTAGSEAATWDFVNSAVAPLQTRVSGTCAAGQGMGAIDPNGNVTCQSASGAACLADNGGLCSITQATKSALDTDLAAGNIKSGVNIFGVVGTLIAAVPPAAKTCSSATGIPVNVTGPQGLASACANYCGTFTPSVSCSFSAISTAGSSLYDNYSYFSCTASNLTPGHPAGLSYCVLGPGPPEYTTTCSCF